MENIEVIILKLIMFVLRKLFNSEKNGGIQIPTAL